MAGHLYDQTVLDNFNDNSLAGNWFDWGGAQTAETNSRLEVTYPGSDGSWGLDDTTSRETAEMFYGAKLLSAPSQDTANRRLSVVAITYSSGNTFTWRLTNGQAQAWTTVGGSASQVGSNLAYNSSVHVYFACGVNASGDLQWMWSTDGEYFTVHHTASNPYGTTTATAISVAAVQTGAAAGTPTAIWDDWSRWTVRPVSMPVRIGGSTVLAVPKVRVGGAWVAAVPNARSASAWIETY